MKSNSNLYLETMLAVQTNNRQEINYTLLEYNGELGEQEQDIGCEAVEQFRKGQSPHAIIALMDAGFDLLSMNQGGKCPLEDMVRFYRRAQSRKSEAAEAIRFVLSRQYDRLIHQIEVRDPLHADYLTKIKAHVTRQRNRTLTLV